MRRANRGFWDSAASPQQARDGALEKAEKRGEAAARSRGLLTEFHEQLHDRVWNSALLQHRLGALEQAVEET